MQLMQTASDRSKLLVRFLIAAVIAIFLWPSAVNAQTSFVRVHQTGYVSSSPKRAYLMSSSSSTGASFSVLNSGGSPVYSRR
jgi:hypothetical protein